MKSFSSLVFLVFISASSAFFYSNPKPEWDGLRAGFGISPFSSFMWLPRTQQEAVEHGWSLDTSAGACGVSGTAFNGNRYRKDNDPATMVLFDKNGFIAGVQAGIPKNSTAGAYPGPQHAKFGVFTEESDQWVITAYFVEPSMICTSGRTQEQFDSQGTGTLLALQNGPTPASLMMAPMSESDVTNTTKFVLGKCFWGMGVHYWYDVSKDMSCDDAFPMFLMYNEGKLNAFGWAFNAFYENSGKWEHPGRSVFSNFFHTVPDCLGAHNKVTTLHMYLSDGARFGNLC